MTWLLWFFLGISFRLALPGYHFEFPRDHGSHPDYKLEWWYFTGHLLGKSGAGFGYELTFFRMGMENEFQNPSRWSASHLYLAHFALSDPSEQQFHFFEKVHRPGPGLAGASPEGLDVWNENWSARYRKGEIQLQATAEGIDLQLSLRPLKKPVVHGRDGVSQKGDDPGRASHYYSLTRLQTRGRLHYRGETFPVTGLSWMDHEFGTNQLSDHQVGWDWFSLQLDSSEEVMLFQIRLRDGRIDPHSAGTLVSPSGQSSSLASGDFSIAARKQWKSPKTGIIYPLGWLISLPAQDARLEVVPLQDDQELVTIRSTGIAYWEGAVRVRGVWRKRPVQGQGYVELTGYDEKHRPDV